LFLLVNEDHNQQDMLQLVFLASYIIHCRGAWITPEKCLRSRRDRSLGRHGCGWLVGETGTIIFLFHFGIQRYAKLSLHVLNFS